MGIVKRPNGYEAQVYFKRKMVAAKRCATEREAKKWYAETVAGYDPTALPFRQRTFDDLLKKYEDEVLLVSRPNTASRYKIDIDHRIVPFFRYRRLNDITPSLISQFRSNLVNEGAIGAKSINMCLSVLSTILRYAVEWDWLTKTPYKLKPLKLPPNEYFWWDNRSDLNAFLSITENFPTVQLAYHLALECGIRRGENLGLSPKDINLDRRTIHVWRQWDVKQKKYGPPKHNRARYVGWSENSALETLLAKRMSETTDSDILHSFDGRGHRISANTLAFDNWYRAIEMADVPQIRFHDCRHTFCSWYMLMGGTEWDLLALSGHKNLDSLRRYAHLKKDNRKILDFGWSPEGKATARQNPELKIITG